MLPLTVVVAAVPAGCLAGSPALASGGGGCGGPITEARGSEVEIRQFCFTPTVLRAPTGTRVTFTNLDPYEHNVLGANGAWDSFEPLRFDGARSYLFARSGVYPFVCVLHPGMVGTVVVDFRGSGRRHLIPFPGGSHRRPAGPVREERPA